MPRINTAVDPPYTQRWIEPIGKFVLNFAAVELESYMWLAALLEEGKSTSSMIGAPFKIRVDALLKRIAFVITDSTRRGRYELAWSSALDIARRRNVLVHNPLVYGWSTTDQSGPPDVLGIPDLNHLGVKIVTTDPMLTLPELTALVNHTSALAQELHALRQELEGHENSVA